MALYQSTANALGIQIRHVSHIGDQWQIQLGKNPRLCILRVFLLRILDIQLPLIVAEGDVTFKAVLNALFYLRNSSISSAVAVASAIAAHSWDKKDARLLPLVLRVSSFASNYGYHIDFEQLRTAVLGATSIPSIECQLLLRSEERFLTHLWQQMDNAQCKFGCSAQVNVKEFLGFIQGACIYMDWLEHRARCMMRKVSYDFDGALVEQTDSKSQIAQQLLSKICIVRHALHARLIVSYVLQSELKHRGDVSGLNSPALFATIGAIVDSRFDEEPELFEQLCVDNGTMTDEASRASSLLRLDDGSSVCCAVGSTCCSVSALLVEVGDADTMSHIVDQLQTGYEPCLPPRMIPIVHVLWDALGSITE